MKVLLGGHKDKGIIHIYCWYVDDTFVIVNSEQDLH